MTQLFSDMTEAGSDPGVKGVIITGAGKYYSAGVDLSAMIKPMAPSKLVRQIRDSNEKVFLAFINFPKPMFDIYRSSFWSSSMISDGSWCT